MARELPAELSRYLACLLKWTRRRYRKRLTRCQKHFSEKAVHDLRVETRRGLALLKLMQAIKLGDLEKPRKVLKRRLDAFGDLRDAQVGLGILKRVVRKHAEAREFETFLRKRERDLIACLRREIKTLKSRRVERMFKCLEREVTSAQGETTGRTAAAEVLARPLITAFQRVTALRRKIRRSDTRTIHSTRVAFKTYRYLCELLQPFLPWMSGRRLRKMHRWQAFMGDIQDMEVLLEQMERAVKRGRVSLKGVKRPHAAMASRLATLVTRFLKTAGQLEEFRPQFETSNVQTRPSRATARVLAK